uniref:TPA: orf y n=1 Tax=Tanacetum cinerariifolium TaxID=118510 RepID=A0A6L2MDQ5_TANCI|nr:TPA: orf y [Tanacetum cinerariifolium]
MSLANLKATTKYQEAVQASEDIDSPAVGFAETSDYKGGLANLVNVVIKQNNTLLYLPSKQSQKLVELEEKFDKLKQKVYTTIEKEIQPADLEDSISSLAKRLDHFSINDQIRGYRAMTRGRYQAARATRRVLGRNSYNTTLGSDVDPERQLELSRERRANLVPAEVLYSNNKSIARHRVYQHYSEQRIMCINDNQTNLPLCNQQSYQSLRTLGLQHIHLGIFMIRLHVLHRRSADTNALVVLRDTTWEDSGQIIETMEVDLSAGTQLVCMFPDMVLSIDDFHNHVEVAIQTHGYDTWQGGKSNLLVTMAMIDKLSNTSYMGFQYSADNIVDHLTTTGITAIPGQRRSIKELEGKSWNLKPSEQTTVRVPSRVAVNERLNRSLSLQFERYRQEPQPARYDAPKNTTPIEEIAASGWGDKFSDDETTPGRVTIFNESKERSDWDADKISGGKIIVIQEKLAQNQQDFFDEYLPQWDDQLATRKQRSELEWENIKSTLNDLLSLSFTATLDGTRTMVCSEGFGFKLFLSSSSMLILSPGIVVMPVVVREIYFHSSNDLSAIFPFGGSEDYQSVRTSTSSM